ncbi:hypothetical protein [Chitinophaga sp. CCNWLW40]|uniref:hypothetical protein n=1 Tax=Chitinophaga sp. CCNWLW40 TaxID=3122070 RepID=UPI0038B3C1A7
MQFHQQINPAIGGVDGGVGLRKSFGLRDFQVLYKIELFIFIGEPQPEVHGKLTLFEVDIMDAGNVYAGFNRIWRLLAGNSGKDP